jgi:hypothetical protein
MPVKKAQSDQSETALDAASMSSLRLGDFALLDKLLLLEASVKRSRGVPDLVRTSLLNQLAALKDDVRVICMVLVGEAPARTAAVPLPEWARSDGAQPQDEGKERANVG